MKYKKGDIVKIIRCIHGHEFKKHDIVKIIEKISENDDSCYCVKNINTRAVFYVTDEEIKPC